MRIAAVSSLGLASGSNIPPSAPEPAPAVHQGQDLQFGLFHRIDHHARVVQVTDHHHLRTQLLDMGQSFGPGGCHPDHNDVRGVAQHILYTDSHESPIISNENLKIRIGGKPRLLSPKNNFAPESRLLGSRKNKVRRPPGNC